MENPSPSQVSDPIPLWKQLAESGGVALDESRIAQLQEYLRLLAEANAKMNLTRIADPAIGHVADALTLLPVLPPKAVSVADVGTGAGVPGIILAIVRPGLAVTLIEATKKKAAVCQATVVALGLTNIKVISERAEELAYSPARESFDCVVARAVATMDWLVEWCLPLTKVGGVMLAMKGPRGVEELAASKPIAKKLGGGDAEVLPVQVEALGARVIIRIPKRVVTPWGYPRRATAAKGKSLAEIYGKAAPR
jgi:16S rRNA (guanine527-N7)-methyltransferase